MKKILVILVLMWPVVGFGQEISETKMTEVAGRVTVEAVPCQETLSEIFDTFQQYEKILISQNETITTQRILIKKQHDLILKLYAKLGIIAP